MQNDHITYIFTFKSISTITELPAESDLDLFVTVALIKDIFFTQLAVINEDAMFLNDTLVNTIKNFIKKALLLHLHLEITRLSDSTIDNSQTLKDVKALDYITNNLIIPNQTHKNAANQMDLSTLSTDGIGGRRMRQRHRN